MISIHVVAKGLDEAPEKFFAFREAIRERKATMLDQIGTDIVGRAREDYLSGPRPEKLGRGTGDLAISVNREISGDSVTVGSNLPYAAIHEYGGTTRPHLIYPKNARALHFMRGQNMSSTMVKRGNKMFPKRVMSGGFDVFALAVHHPGSKIPARPYLSPAMEDSRKDDGPNGMRGIVMKQVEEAKKQAGFDG